MLNAIGTLRYYENWSIVELGYDFYAYYRALIPKYIRVNPPKYPAHITVVRKNIEQWQNNWGYRENGKIFFSYSPEVYFDGTYYFLECTSVDIEQIRTKLGLPKYRMNDCYHITVGNTK